MEYAQADALNHAIRLLAIRHRSRAGTLLAELGLHPGQEAILMLLDAHGPCTQVQLAAGAGCEPPSVTLMVQKLEAAGLLNRSSSETDGRVLVVELTPAGVELMPALKRRWLELAERTVAELSTSVDQLVSTLGELTHALDNRPSPAPQPR